MDKTTWLADFFEHLGEIFEKFNPAAFRVIAAILPYATPFPVAWLTMRSAETFLRFTSGVAFIFVFSLESMGLWFTSLFVDSIIDVIRSRNTKTIALVVLFGMVVFAYVSLLINLNVTLKASSGDANPALERVITLLCFLPLLTGVGNGYYKWKLEQKDNDKKAKNFEIEKEERRHQEKREDKLKGKLISQGINPLVQYQSSSPTPLPPDTSNSRSDWRTLSEEERKEVMYVLTPDQIMKKYKVGKATAYNWKNMKSKLDKS